MAKILRKGHKAEGLSHFKLPRFFPDWKPGDAYGYEDHDFPNQRIQIKPDDIEQEIQARIAEEEVKWEILVDEARAKGVQEGIRQGRETGRQEIEPAVDLLQHWIRVLEAERVEFFRNLEESLLKLGVYITEKIISREIRQDMNIVKNLVSSSLAKVSHGGKISIRVHPEDLEIVKSMSLGELLPHGISGDIAVEGDQKVDQGGCLIETPGGIIDARIRTQLDELFQEIFGEDENTKTKNGENGAPEVGEEHIVGTDLNDVD